MKKEYFYIVKEMKKFGITPQEIEKYWNKESELETKLIKIKEDAISRFLGKIILTGSRSYLLVNSIDVQLHYSEILIIFIGPKLDINILDSNTISIHTWDSIHYGLGKCGGEYSILFTNIESIDWGKILIIEQDVFNSEIDQLQDKVSLFVSSLKDYFYEVKI